MKLDKLEKFIAELSPAKLRELDILLFGWSLQDRRDAERVIVPKLIAVINEVLQPAINDLLDPKNPRPLPDLHQELARIKLRLMTFKQ